MSPQIPEPEFNFRDELAPGSHWSYLLRRGSQLRLVDVAGGANVGMLLYNPLDKLERYNAPDTLKCQHTFRLTRGHCLYSDMGRIFCSVIEDDLGWHDTVCGNLSERRLQAQYTVRSYQQALNGWTVSGEQALRVEMAKHGLGERDLAANVNFFSKVVADAEGVLRYVTGHSHAGASVVLRFEMDTLVLLHTCPHPLNPVSEYPDTPVTLDISRAAPVAFDDVCLNACEENRRGFDNNQRYHQWGEA
ncbi:MAG: urea carboxylase [Halioglobus sp.]|nr:urea carboxylase [Halioglobus sp.]|tara:strand:- start:2460 stop:3200 length:741 start_codon:yes stop_codon:yes gene_type:complete